MGVGEPTKIKMLIDLVGERFKGQWSGATQN
jgi:hypothetical protein